eukprot:scaffold81018_cov18-Prasinocladus_malaysianus.AAC.1
MRLGSVVLRSAKGGCKRGTNWAAASVRWTSGRESSQSMKWMNKDFSTPPTPHRIIATPTHIDRQTDRQAHT